MRKSKQLGVWPLLVVLGQLVSAARARKNYQTLPEVKPLAVDFSQQQASCPGVSVIIPARNEAANLPRLLTSLVRQDYPCYEVLVIDDASTDETAAIARSYSKHSVQLIALTDLPKGWTGKNYACWVGAKAARYPWLLFVDADTELAPSALNSTLHFCTEHTMQVVSLFARQRCETFWERLLLPFAYQHYFVSTDKQVNNQHGPALANGQYLLIRSDVYWQVGGHAANAGSIIDDAALAGRLKQAGIIAFACRGEQLVSVRMYTSLGQIVNGLGKNVYPYLQQAPLTGLQTALSTTLAAAVMFLFVDAGRKRSSALLVLALLAYIAQVLNAIPWLKHFRIHLWYALLTPYAALVFIAIAINSMLHTITGRSVMWKGRRYRT